MITVRRDWTGQIPSHVAPLLESDWDAAKHESLRRVEATKPKSCLNGTIVGRAYDSLIRHFPDCQTEIDSWSADELVEVYLDL